MRDAGRCHHRQTLLIEFECPFERGRVWIRTVPDNRKHMADRQVGGLAAINGRGPKRVIGADGNVHAAFAKCVDNSEIVAAQICVPVTASNDRVQTTEGRNGYLLCGIFPDPHHSEGNETRKQEHKEPVVPLFRGVRGCNVCGQFRVGLQTSSAQPTPAPVRQRNVHNDMQFRGRGRCIYTDSQKQRFYFLNC